MTSAAVPRDVVLSLVGRAAARSRFPELGLSDPWAEAMAATLDLDPAGFDERALRTEAVRTMAVDRLVRRFFARSPHGLAVALNAGLCTRFSRVDNGTLRWVDLDPPPVADFKCAHRPSQPSDRHAIARRCSLACTGWMDCLRGAGDVPTLVIAEGALERQPHALVDAFFTKTSARLPRGTELIVDCEPSPPLRTPPGQRVCLEIPTPDGSVARYPRLRAIGADDAAAAPPRPPREVSREHRLPRGGESPSVLHLRFE
ncbi:O-methyltransferase-related protein [Sorangium cellulosum]|uniref:O-methyltransferase-related protein n=1 Tax=Sorangium cellulosum TaxID=56 RepID=A0A2L0F188_SORCE|nr:class I SAM-dependent methyltransferase [Sorangium cellulosum]AUX45324.1 O-methyltransferase-related protein [Sorangium cellulosum]